MRGITKITLNDVIMDSKAPLIALVSALVFGLFSIANAQEQRIHNLYGEALGPGIAYSVNYDTRFAPGHADLGFRAGAGYWTYSPERLHRFVLPLQLNYLIGKRRHLMEVGAGATFINSGGGGSEWDMVSEEGWGTAATLSAGYRFQPLHKGINARAGATLLYSTAGLPLVLPSVSVGYTFSR